MRRLAVRCLGIMLGVLVIAVTASVFWAWDSYRAEGPLEKPVTIIIPKGTGVQDIAGLLTSAGAIDNVRLFVLGALRFSALVTVSHKQLVRERSGHT